MLFGPNQSFLFLSDQQLLDFQSCFSFSEANCWASLASFSKLLFGGNVSLDQGRRLVPLKVPFPEGMSAKRFPLAFRESTLECPGILTKAKAARKSHLVTP